MIISDHPKYWSNQIMAEFHKPTPLWKLDLVRLQANKIGQREHENSYTCWCNPTLEYQDPANGNRVYVHHKPN